jgi:hypothetical protein
MAVNLTTPVSASTVNIIRDALIAVEAALGTQPASVYGTVANRLSLLEVLITGGVSGVGSLLQTGVSASHTITGLTGTTTVTLSPTEYANQVIRFIGTAASGLTLSVALPVVSGDISGYTLWLDFTLCTMASISSLTFSVGATTYHVSVPTTNVTYMVSWDGTTLSASVMTKA